MRLTLTLTMALALMGCATNTALLATCQRAAQLNDDTDRAADEIADLFLAPVGETRSGTRASTGPRR